MAKSFASLFSGGGLADVGMMQAGWIPLWGIEQRGDIAECYRQNIHACILVADVTTVDFAGLERPDHLHASPPCTRASVANSNAKESPLDNKLAQAVCRAIRTLRPDTFTLENVYGYRKFAAYHNICACLDAAGYWWEHHHINAADMAVPQTRKRLMLRATLSDHLRPLPSPVPWVGWYAAIEDLIPTLPASKFADWQLLRLKDSDFADTFLQMTSNTQKSNPTGTGVLARPAPANTVTSADGARPRAFLAEGTGHFPFTDAPRGPSDLETRFSTRMEEEPATTVKGAGNGFKAFLVADNTKDGDGLNLRDSEEPAGTVLAKSTGGNHPRAFIVHPNDMRTMPTRDGDEPMFTVMATGDINGRSNAGFKPRAFLVDNNYANSHDAEEKRLKVFDTDQPAMTVVSGSERIVTRAFLVDGKPLDYTGDTLQIKGQPSETPAVTATQGQHPFRALIMDCQQTRPTNGGNLTIRDRSEPLETVRSETNTAAQKAWLSQGRVVSMTPRALARFMSLPDWYVLPPSKKLACTILGNGVPCLMMQRIAESLTP